MTMSENITPIEADLLPLALIALEVGESVDRLAHRFGEAVVLDDVGLRAVPAATAREFFTARAEQRARFEEATRRRRAEPRARRVHAGVPSVEGSSPMESLVAAEAAAGTYSTPKDDFGLGRGNPHQELMDEAFAEGQRQIRERRALAEARKKERLAEAAKDELGGRP